MSHNFIVTLYTVYMKIHLYNSKLYYVIFMLIKTYKCKNYIILNNFINNNYRIACICVIENIILVNILYFLYIQFPSKYVNFTKTI